MSDSPTQRIQEDCPFCRELQSGLIDPEYRAYTQLQRRCLLLKDGVAVIPSVAPLRRGHALVLPIRHVSAAAHLDHAPKKALADVIEMVAENVCSPGTEPLVFEHGVGLGVQGGCGIEHAHIHLLPVSHEERLRAEETFAFSYETAEAGPLPKALARIPSESSYGVIGLPGALRLAVSELPSQTLRRCVADAIGSRSGDWRDLGSWDVMEETFVSLAA